jgi:hypothetical protein
MVGLAGAGEAGDSADPVDGNGALNPAAATSDGACDGSGAPNAMVFALVDNGVAGDAARLCGWPGEASAVRQGAFSSLAPAVAGTVLLAMRIEPLFLAGPPSNEARPWVEWPSATDVYRSVCPPPSPTH